MRESFHLVTVENCFRVQTVVELVFSTFPQLVIQGNNNNKAAVGWSGIAVITMIVLVAMIIKNTYFLTLFAARRMIDNRVDAQMRPFTAKQLSRIELEAFSCIQAYLIDPQDDGDD